MFIVPPMSDRIEQDIFTPYRSTWRTQWPECLYLDLAHGHDLRILTTDNPPTGELDMHIGPETSPYQKAP